MPENKKIIEGYLNEEGYEYKFEDKDKFFKLEFKGDTSFLSVTVLISEMYVAVLSRLPLTVEEKKLSTIAELLHRINSGLVNGCFVVDFETGEIEFQTGITFLNLELTKELFENLFMTNLSTADNFAKAIMTVLSSDTPPQKVLEDIEAQESIPKESS